MHNWYFRQRTKMRADLLSAWMSTSAMSPTINMNTKENLGPPCLEAWHLVKDGQVPTDSDSTVVLTTNVNAKLSEQLTGAIQTTVIWSSQQCILNIQVGYISKLDYLCTVHYVNELQCKINKLNHILPLSSVCIRLHKRFIFYFLWFFLKN